MIRNIFLLMAFFGLAIGANAQSHDTMYIMKDGDVVAKYHVNNEIDSVIFYQPQGQAGNTFVDDRDGNVYRFVTIGDQTWMADNLRYLPFVTDSTEILDTPGLSEIWCIIQLVCRYQWRKPFFQQPKWCERYLSYRLAFAQ